MFSIVLITIFIALIYWAMCSENHKLERICDVTLFFFIVIPILIMMLVTPFCHGWNEGGASGACTIPVLTGLYNGINVLLLAFAFGGIFFVGPIILVALLTTLILKIIRIAKWIRNKKAQHAHVPPT